MSFDVNTFIADPSTTVLCSLTKPQLKQVVDAVSIECDINAKKVVLQQVLLDYFIEEGLILEQPSTSSNELEIKRLELEHKAQEQRLEQEGRIKLKELELQEKELEMKDKEIQLQIKLKELELMKSTPVSTTESLPATASATPSFDVSRQVRLVPQFQEVDKFFLHFEKVATSLHWPPESHTMLLQSVLIGKAREVYSALSVEQSANYEVVKREILKAYELVPEAYRQQFRELKCKEGQTYYGVCSTEGGTFQQMVYFPTSWR